MICLKVFYISASKNTTQSRSHWPYALRLIMTTRYPPSYPIEDLTRTLKIIKPLPSQIATFALIQPPPLQIVTNEHHPLLNSNQNPLLGEQMTSSTTTVTLLPQSSTTTPFPQAFAHTCSHCGAELSHAHSDLAAEAQRRISELEAQVKILTDKATAAGKTSPSCILLFSPLVTVSLISCPTVHSL